MAELLRAAGYLYINPIIMYNEKQLAMMSRDQLKAALEQTQQQMAAIQRELKASESVKQSLYQWLKKGQACGPRLTPNDMEPNQNK